MSEGTAEEVLSGEATWSLYHGDCLEMLRLLPDNSVDALVTDPPSGISFMSRAWDKDKGGRDKWIAWLAEIMREAFRVMKPGAHGFVWAIPRTSHWTGMALEDAGFEIRDSFHHLFSTGFPKSLAADKAIDAKLGVTGTIVGPKFDAKYGRPMSKKQASRGGAAKSDGWARPCLDDEGFQERSSSIIEPASVEAKEWKGFGTAVKPAHEVWWLIRKPLEGTLAENLLKWGVGALNIDGCRVAHAGAADLAAHESQVAALKARGGSLGESWKNTSDLSGANDVNSSGRFPANLVLSHAPECKRAGTSEVAAAPTWDTPNRETKSAFTGSEVSKVRHVNGRDGEASADKRYASQGSTSFAPLPGARRDDTETVEQWECVEGCPVRELAMQSASIHSAGSARSAGWDSGMGYHGSDGGVLTGARIGDSGSAARYFPQFQHDPELDDIMPFRYEPKPARGEKDAGLDHFRARSGAEATDSEEGQARLESPRSGAGRKGGARNVHPTVKGVELIRYFTRMVARPKRVVLDLFGGAGTGGVAALLEGCRWIGAELNDTDEEPFCSIIKARLAHTEGLSFIPRESLRSAEPPKQASLFSFSEGVSK